MWRNTPITSVRTRPQPIAVNAGSAQGDDQKVVPKATPYVIPKRNVTLAKHTNPARQPKSQVESKIGSRRTTPRNAGKTTQQHPRERMSTHRTSNSRCCLGRY